MTSPLSRRRFAIPSATCRSRLAIGTSTIIALYLLCNLCYLAALPVHAIQTAPQTGLPR